MSRTFKVGLFVTLGIVVSVLIVFTIGDSRRFWDSKVTYDAEFTDVVGLKPGAPVRMGGLDIGQVTDVSHSADPNDARIHVKLSVAKTEAVRVREDSVAKISAKGLLGDKMVEISPGDQRKPQVAANGALRTEEPLDFTRYAAKLESIANKTEQTVANLENVTRSLGDPKVAEDLRGTIANLNAITGGVARNKDGAAHKLIFDPEQGKRIDHTIANLEGITTQLNAVSGDLREMTSRVKSGPGLAHAMVYDDKLPQELTGVMSETRQALEAVRTGNGVAHAVVYGDQSTRTAIDALVGTLLDVRYLVGQVRAGKGTIGALLVDPSVYEDIKQLVGNVDRNQVLRAFVRYSIKEDEAKRGEPPPKVEVAPKK
jgi:phospholipid/cholesterol/gamma-HCH transport system substrate-binding protein